MSLVAVTLTVTFDHEPGHILAPEDLVLGVVHEAFEETCGDAVATVVIDDVNLPALSTQEEQA